MAVSTTPGSRWPARAAYLAAAIFIGASGAINITYGWAKGTDLPGQLTWAAVAGAVAIVFALSWPALIRSLEARRWSAAIMAAAALALAGSYSVTAALGSAAGGRMNAAATETATSGAQARAQAAYRLAETELAKLTPARPAGELEALLRAAQRDPRRYGCAAVNGSLAVNCPKLESELARSRQREKLQADMVRASDALNAGPAKVANSDAKALARYLGAVGWPVEADRLNDLLVLLSVLMIEVGGGLSLALGMALSGLPAGRREAAASAATGVPATAEKPAQALPSVVPAAVSGALPTTIRPLPDTPAIAVRPAIRLVPDPASDTVIAWLRSRGGKAIGVRQAAEAIGRPRSTLADQLHRLAGQGRVVLTPGRRGTVIELAPADRAN